VYYIGRLQFPYSYILLQPVCDGAVTVLKAGEQKLKRQATQKHFNKTEHTKTKHHNKKSNQGN
jgi:hypothetical protein